MGPPPPSDASTWAQAFALNVRPAVDTQRHVLQGAGAAPSPRTSLEIEAATMQHGVPVHIGEPMGLMDKPAGSMNLPPRAITLLGTIPLWKRVLAAALLKVAAGARWLDRKWGGTRLAKRAKPTRGTTVIRIENGPFNSR